MATLQERINAEADRRASSFHGRAGSTIRAAVQALADEVGVKRTLTVAQLDAIATAAIAGGDPPAPLVNLFKTEIVAKLEAEIPDETPP